MNSNGVYSSSGGGLRPISNMTEVELTDDHDMEVIRENERKIVNRKAF